MINISGYQYTKEELKAVEDNKKIVLGLTKEQKAKKLTLFIRYYNGEFNPMEKEQIWNFILNHLTRMGFDYSEILTAYLNENM